ncbi:MAG: DUF6263 family protein [Pirellulaceae bacterium]
MCNRFTARSVLFALFLMGSVATVTAQGQDANLAWNLKAGEEFTLELRQKTDTVTAVEKKLIRVSLEVDADLLWRVLSVDEKGFDILQTVTGMTVKMQLPDKDGTLEYDSRVDENPRGSARTISLALQPLLAAKVRMKMDRRGNVTDVSTELDEEIGAKGQSESLRELFTPDVMSEMLAQVFPVLPGQSQKNWSSSVQRELPLGKVNMKTDYALGAVENGLTAIDVKGQLKLVEQDKAQQRTLRLDSAEIIGSLHFDQDAGRFRKGDVQQTVVAESREQDMLIRTKVTSRLRFVLHD